MAIHDVNPKCFILALFVRDDGERFLLGDGYYEFKDSQLQFQANTVANDVIEVQGNDGYLLAGQVRRPGTQSFDGYIGDGLTSKPDVEQYRRDFFQFFRKNHFYKVVYVFPDGTAIQRKRGFLVDDPTVSELYQQYPEYHVALNFEDINYYSYSENDEGEEIYAKEALIYLSAGATTGGLVWDEYGVVWEDVGADINRDITVVGKDLTIQNPTDDPVPVTNLRINGDTFQHTYSGKNLFDVDTVGGASAGNNSVSYTIVNGGIEITQTGTNGNGYVWFSLPESFLGKNLTLSFSSILIDGSTGTRIRLVDQNGANTTGSWAFNPSADNLVKTFALPSELPTGVTEYRLYFYVNGENVPGVAGAKVGYNQIQIEANSTATSYEPYVGGTVSPNPDYPQDVQVVTGEQVVTISNGETTQSHLIDLRGTNLLDLNSFVIGGMGAGVPSTAAKYRINNADKPIKVEPDTPYTISAQLVSPVQGFRIGVHECQADGTFIRDLGWQQLATSAYTFTTGSTTGLVKIVGSLSTTSTNVTTNGTEDTTACDTVAEFMRGCTLMLEEGSSASAYLPYNPVELCKIGDYKDYIYNSEGDWYLHKEVGKTIIDGSETYSRVGFNNISGYHYYATTAIDSLLKPGETSAYSNRFFTAKNIAAYNDVLRPGFPLAQDKNMAPCFSTASAINTNPNSYALRFAMPDSEIADTAAFTNWLSNNNTTIYYVLDTATDTQITDTNLIDQLDALAEMTLGAGTNNITVTSTGFNGEIQFTYRIVGVTTGGAVWEDGGGGGPTTVEVDSIDNVYPIWTITGPATDPQLSVLSTNTTINYVGNITASQTLVIDMLNKTALLNGTSVIGNVYGDWVNFAPGNNRVVYTTDNTDALPSKIEWQEVVG